MIKKRSNNPPPDLNFYHEKERMDLILSTLNTGLILLDHDMTVVWANAMIWKMFPDENLYGKKCYAVAENRTTPCLGCRTIDSFQDGEIHEREFQNTLNKRWYYVISFPIKDEQGRVVNVLEATTDIHDRKQTELSRDKALKDLKVLQKRIEEENIYLKKELREVGLFSDIIGTSNELQYVLKRVQQVAETDATVLILGETGVGKELVARAIHDSSTRSDQPFISINCAALSPNLVESELFGHERGAFTDAQQQRKGRFEMADGGTLLLDEISELPPEPQAKLLRVLQDGKFERIGGSLTIESDVRIIAATNRDLNNEVSSGRFRPDLFYRLNVYPITVPPLRKRSGDIPLLVEHFITIFNKKFGKNIEEVAPPTMDALLHHHWPGNIRELRNIIERAIITSSGTKLVLSDQLCSANELSKQTNVSGREDGLQILPLEELERRHIRRALEATAWQISGLKGAARILRINPSTLRSRIKKMGLEKPEN